MFLCVYDFLQRSVLQKAADVCVQFTPEAACGTVLFPLAGTALAQAAHWRYLAFKMLKNFFHINVSRSFGQSVAAAGTAYRPQYALSLIHISVAKGLISLEIIRAVR